MTRHRVPRWALGIAAVLLVGGAVALTLWGLGRRSAPGELELSGNVDVRQVSLAFQDSQRISAVLVQEGDRVHQGQVLATLDTSRSEQQVAQAEAQVAAQQAVVDGLHAGTRPQQIAQSRAGLAGARADAANAHATYQRLLSLLEPGGVSQQDVDSARAAMEVADAQVAAAEQALALAVAGPRPEDIAQGEAQLEALSAQAAVLKQQLADATLTSPVDGTVRSRLMEPGELASPQTPVVVIAVDDPKWVRTYVSETDLTRVRPGMRAYVLADGAPGRRFPGWVGFISSIAEFTPKTVQTRELRTSLVYEMRVFVDDPSDVLRLGMPVTVVLPEGQDAGPATGAEPAPTQPAQPGAEQPVPPEPAPARPAPADPQP